MKPLKDLTIGELAAFISSHLERQGIKVVLSGGSCVSIYSENRYASLDLDFIEYSSVGRRKLKQVLAEIGFRAGKDRYFRHSDTEMFVEFPAGPPSVGREPIKEIITLSFATGELKIISPTDCVKDRLAAYYYWQDRQALEQAILVAQNNTIDLQEVQRWSEAEGQLTAFQQIKHLLPG